MLSGMTKYRLKTMELSDVAEMLHGFMEDADSCSNEERADTCEAMELKVRAAITEMQALRNALDTLGVAIADAGYTWTPEMRKAYEVAPNGQIQRAP